MLDLKKSALPLAALAALGLAAAPAAHAQTTTIIPVTNGDFEANTTSSDSNSNFNSIPGWSGPSSGITLGNPPLPYDYGVQRENAFGNAFPGGDSTNHFAFIYTGTYIQQDTTFATTAGDTYTLTAQIGEPSPDTADHDSLNLYDGTGSNANLLATTGALTLVSGAFTPETLTFVAPASGTDLVIRLIETTADGTTVTPSSSPSTEGAFDNVGLTQTAAAPEPSQTAALGLGVLGLAGLTLRARRRAA